VIEWAFSLFYEGTKKVKRSKKRNPGKRVAIILLSLVITVALTFGILIAADSLFCLNWLTDSVAFTILIIAAILSLVISIICSGAAHNTRQKAKAEAYQGDDYNNHAPQKQLSTKRHGKRKKTVSPVLPICISVVVILVVGVAGYNYFAKDEIDDIPYDVTEFGDKYPEVRDYVKNFNKYKDKEFEMDVTAEMDTSDIPLFIQWDKRWGYKHYGQNYIGVAGCGPTCITMVACGLKDDPEINPYVVCEYSNAQGYYTYGQGTAWSFMTDGAKHYGLGVTNGSVTSEWILGNLSSDSPMICSMGAGDFTKAGHFIVLTGIDDEGKIVVNDPNSPNNSSKHWDIDTLISQMRNVWKYSYSS
jgi:hypothetical protein